VEPALLERALLAGRACSVAFVPPTAMAQEPYAADLRYIAQVEDPVTQTGATVYSIKSTGQLCIACRGSASIRNFQTNLNIGPVPLTLTEGGTPHPTAKVHTGFQSAAAALWTLLEPKLPTATDASEPVLVTGHSLGGGIATLLALHLHAAGRDAALLTVAGPRLGDAAFAQLFRERCTIPAVHLVHDDDEVLASNVELWDRLGFEHVGCVVKCDKDSPCVYESEDPECLADGDAPATPRGPPSLRGVFVDHCRYLGLYIGLRLEHPSVWLRAP